MGRDLSDGAVGVACGRASGAVDRRGRYTTTSKGKKLRGLIGEAIMRVRLPLRVPFGALSAPAIAERVREITERMQTEGRLKAAYSAHDLRHASAVRLYQETHDVYAVRVALGHANVSVTEKYLCSLGLAE